MRKVTPLLAIINFFFFTVFSYGQGTVRGKITDENGETVIGATVVQKTNHSVWSVTDLDGNYSLKIPDSLEQTMMISLISYKTIEENVKLKGGQVLVKNYVMKSSALEMKEVEVTAKVVRAREYFTEMVKKNSATSIDFVSSESIKKTGDANVTAAVARVAGVSTNGSFITVRGIGDRYVKTSINGSRIPTLDPFTNNIKLDLFPASLVDNIIITKTASPDLPGDWAGAYLSVETKDYPDELAINVETTFGYNSQSTFNDIVSSQRSSTDWLGYDSGFREHNHLEFSKATINPSQYLQFVGLGLGSYYNSLGVTEANWNNNSDTYYRLGLVQLGLLAPAQINDNAAYQTANLQYINGSYASQAFVSLNGDVPKTGKSFANNWNTVTRKAPLDFSQSFSIGNQTKLFGKPLGFLLGYRYGSSVKYDPHSSANRARADGLLESSAASQNSIESNGWSALMNLAYKLNTNNSVSLLFMPNFTGVNKVQDALDSNDSTQFVYTKSQFYEQRKQLVYQFKSEHYLPGQKIKAELNASYTNGKSSVPDFKNLQYYYNAKDGTYQIGGTIGEGIHRYYRYLSDNLFDSRASLEFPLSNKPALVRKLKAGGAYQRNDKTSDQYDYQVLIPDRSYLKLNNGDLDAFFNLDNFAIVSGTSNGIPYSTVNAYYTRSNSPADHTFGNSTLYAAFLMTDYSINNRLRFSGGMRAERVNIFTDVFKFDSLGYAANDPRRGYQLGLPVANPGRLNETTFLPSVNIIYKLRSDEQMPINLRLNYSRTVARPSIRELSEVAAYDYEFRAFVFGNSELKPVHINNYDFRAESYFKSGDNVSVSVFYKDFKNHIEVVKSIGLTWQNVDNSNVSGIELEGKKILPAHFDVRANITLVDSRTTFARTRLEVASNGTKNYVPLDTITHPMFGQAPYVINTILSYTADSLGLTVSLGYNVQGSRLVIASDTKEIPDIYEVPRDLFDIKVSKKIGKHFSASFSVRDILNAPVTREYKGWNIKYDEYHYGTNYLFGVSYKL